MKVAVFVLLGLHALVPMGSSPLTEDLKHLSDRSLTNGSNDQALKVDVYLFPEPERNCKVSVSPARYNLSRPPGSISLLKSTFHSLPPIQTSRSISLLKSGSYNLLSDHRFIQKV